MRSVSENSQRQLRFGARYARHVGMEFLLMVDQTSLTDSDIFRTAKDLYNAFDTCSGFWTSGFITPARAESSALTAFHHETGRLKWLAKSKNSSDVSTMPGKRGTGNVCVSCRR